MSSMKSFNTEVTIESYKCGEYSAWLAEVTYADEIFLC